jgi:hypothetical protein
MAENREHAPVTEKRKAHIIESGILEIRTIDKLKSIKRKKALSGTA